MTSWTCTGAKSTTYVHPSSTLPHPFPHAASLPTTPPTQQSDYAEREKLENINYQVNQINDMLGELSMHQLDVSPKVEEIPT